MADLDQGLGWITFLADGVKREVTFRQLQILFGFNYGEGTEWKFSKRELQSVWTTIAEGVYSSSRSKAAQIRSPILRYVHKELANTFFARKTTDQLLNYKITAYNTHFQEKRKLSVGGLVTPILHAAGVDPSRHKVTPPGGMEIKFCKTNLLINHKEVNGMYQFLFKHSTAGVSKMLLPNPDFTTELELNRVEDQVEEEVQTDGVLGEPDCYYFEEYEAPRMNPPVVAAHKRIGLLQNFNK
ncbi:unnamed protein product [Microthlaspi erraticum]|uniref:Arabidopsis retrotransposon Orf1 C-terminal domain-containing protein n=1 Tax=Microthlaspi erraticum TaxID=1685480 RepID=A0A6D2KCR1_9BRAS|nr:unnamed protein product [Microthlaspi erraticum]